MCDWRCNINRLEIHVFPMCCRMLQVSPQTNHQRLSCRLFPRPWLFVRSSRDTFAVETVFLEEIAGIQRTTTSLCIYIYIYKTSIYIYIYGHLYFAFITFSVGNADDAERPGIDCLHEDCFASHAQ